MTTADAFYDAITGALTGGGITELVVDLDDLSFCDVSGISALLAGRTTAVALHRVITPHGLVPRVLGFIDTLPTLAGGLRRGEPPIGPVGIIRSCGPALLAVLDACGEYVLAHHELLRAGHRARATPAAMQMLVAHLDQLGAVTREARRHLPPDENDTP